MLENTVLSHRGLVAVEEGTKYTSLVYCDPFYELLIFRWIVSFENVIYSDSIGAFKFFN